MGLQKINMSGQIKEVSDHLAFDVSLQKSSGFYPCDDKGQPVEAPTEFQQKQAEKKSVEVAVGSEMKEAVIIPPSESTSEAEPVEPSEADIKAKILELHAAGKTNAEISKEVGKHHKQVQKVINESK